MAPGDRGDSVRGQRALVQWNPFLPDYFAASSLDGHQMQLYNLVASGGRGGTTGGGGIYDDPLIATDLDDLNSSPSATQGRTCKLVSTVDFPQSSPLNCLQWYPHQRREFLVAGGTVGRVHIVNFVQNSFREKSQRAPQSSGVSAGGILQTLAMKANRSCNALAWNPFSPSQLAVGLEKLRSEASLLIFDVNTHDAERPITGYSRLAQEGRAPLMSIALNETVTAISYRADVPHVLVYGTMGRWLRVHDCRGNNPGDILSISAHTKAVLGVVLDPWMPDMVATFSETSTELVKVWDLRKVDPNNPEPVTAIRPNVKKAVTQVAWCPFRKGVLAVVQADERAISLWDVRYSENGSGSAAPVTQIVQTPVYTRQASSPVLAMSWQPSTALQVTTLSPTEMDWTLGELVDHSVPNRLMASTRHGFEEISLHEYKPLSVSKRGELLVGCGKILLSHNLAAHVRCDTANVIKERTLCGYSMDVGKNLQIINDELDAASSTPASTLCAYEQRPEELQRLVRVWGWVDRIEDLCERQFNEGEEADADWPVESLLDAGVIHILDAHRGTGEDAGARWVQEPVLHCPVYVSRARRVALKACGWTNEEEGDEDDRAERRGQRLRHIMEECEATAHYERSAALAIWHGDLRAAVNALRRGAEAASQRLNDDLDGDVGQPLEGSRGRPLDGPAVVDTSESSLVELLQLVAMCIAGYSHATADMGGGRKKLTNSGLLWKDMCESLLERPSMQARTMVSYLRAACAFLASISDPPSNPEGNVRRYDPDTLPYRRVLQEPDISLSDRVAFALRFLPPPQLQAYLRQQGEACMAEGNLEGILLFGFDLQGLNLIQAYLDRTGDIQSVALLVSRLPSWPGRTQDEMTLTRDLIDEYRDLLDACQLWHERAVFDVGRADLLSRLHRRRRPEPGIAMTSGGVERGRAGSLEADRDKSTGKSTPTTSTLSVPPQLYVRCNYCNVPIQLNSLRRQGRMGQSWLSRQKPIMNCCPECRKPLPRCYICLLPLGCLNPYLELKRQVQQRQFQQQPMGDESMGGGQQVGASDILDHDSLATLGSLRFTEWFTWCHNCKHGGHAHHIMEWFDTHSECGVSGCNCRCYSQDRHALLTGPPSSSSTTNAIITGTSSPMAMSSPKGFLAGSGSGGQGLTGR